MSASTLRLVLLVDVFPPLRSSGAVQLRDLAAEFARQGHKLTVLIPSPQLSGPFELEERDGFEILRLKAPQTKDVGLIQRALAEIALSFALLSNLARSPLGKIKWDGVIWYSPTIFLAHAAQKLKKHSNARGYLVLRDIFPEWAVDMGVMGRGPAYWFFKLAEAYQYEAADVIGVQSKTNFPYFARWQSKPNRRVEVLQNWLAPAPDKGCSIQLDKTPLAGRRVFVYAGNMGVAQGLDRFIAMTEALQDCKEIGFLFVGRGSEAQRLRDMVTTRAMTNVLFHDEIEPEEIAGLYAQCHAGIIALDPRHKTHNLPGKFLTYMDAGLPVLAAINPGNDLEELINSNGLGQATSGQDPQKLIQMALNVAKMEKTSVAAACRTISDQMFSPRIAVSQILQGLQA